MPKAVSMPGSLSLLWEAARVQDGGLCVTHITTSRLLKSLHLSKQMVMCLRLCPMEENYGHSRL